MLGLNLLGVKIRVSWTGPFEERTYFFLRKSPCYLACQELRKHFSPERVLEAGNRLHTVEVLASKSSPGCAGARIKSQVFLLKDSDGVFGLLTICSTLLLLALERFEGFHMEA